MPYPNQHAAPQASDSGVTDIKTLTENMPDGVSMIVGRKGGESVTISIRFDKDKWTVAEAKKWLKDHDYKTSVEAASGKAEHQLETAELRDVEILRTGKWNGIDWTERDIDEAIRNFENKVVDAPIKITENGEHDGTELRFPGGAAMGWIKSMRRVGERLLADIWKIPRKIAELIKEGALWKKSIEGWTNYPTADGERHGRVIDGLLFSGVGVPAVHGLSDLVTLYMREPAAEGRFCCSSSVEPKDKGDRFECSSSGNGGPAAEEAATGGDTVSRNEAGEKTKKTGGKRNVEEMTILRERFEALIGAEKSVEHEKNARAEFEKQLRETATKLAEKEKELESVRTKLQAYEVKEKQVSREKIASDVEKLVTEGRVEPARKDAEIEYLAGLSIEERKTRVEMLSKLHSILGEKIAAGEPGEGTPKSETEEIRQKALAYQKAHPGVSYRDATAVVTQGR